MCRCLAHAPGVARGADTAALAGQGHKEVVPTVVAAGAGEAVGEDAAFQVFTKGLFDVALRCVVVALAVWPLVGSPQACGGPVNGS